MRYKMTYIQYRQHAEGGMMPAWGEKSMISIGSSAVYGMIRPRVSRVFRDFHAPTRGMLP